MSDQLPVKVEQTSLPAELTERIDEYTRLARGALADNTERAYKADTTVFSEWCAKRGVDPLPASPKIAASFVDAMAETCKPLTVRRDPKVEELRESGE